MAKVLKLQHKFRTPKQKQDAAVQAGANAERSVWRTKLKRMLKKDRLTLSVETALKELLHFADERESRTRKRPGGI